jgi:sugar lactone lactonase YvrE
MASGARGIGPSDVSFLGAGNAAVTITLEGHPDQRAQLGAAGDGFGRLVDLGPGGDWRFGADVATYERTANPDGRQLDSNPYAVLAEPGGRVVVDAGGNSLLRVAADGRISTIAVLPTLPTSEVNSGDPVPTCVTVGPDGAYYVGILAGLPFRDGAARVYRVVPGEAPAEYLTGFKTITDIDFDAAGDLYVLQHSSGATGVAGPGSLVRVAPDGTRATVLDGLTMPTSVVVAPDDAAVYVSNFGLAAGAGEVLRLILAPPAPATGSPSAPPRVPPHAFATLAGLADATDGPDADEGVLS